jgi:type I restriction enzyme M protein
VTTTDLPELERRLWAAADQLRANSSLTPVEYRGPVLGLIFLAFAEHRFDELRPELEAKATERRPVTPEDFRARGVLFVPDIARLSWLVELPEGEDLGANVDLAMDAIEKINAGLAGVLPRGYQKLEKAVLLELVRLFAPLPRTVSGDAFGLIYEYFLAEFAANEGRRGGEFFTPQSIVKLIVEVMEPLHGKVYDPACGSGGMFVHSARFVENHSGSPTRDLSVYGQEQKEGTVPLSRMNLALHGLSGDIRLANSYYDDLHDAVRRFDFVMANPPFFNGIDKSKLEGDARRFPFGLPRPDNGNYVWIQLFYSALNETGRAGFVMANSASDARASEAEIRRQLIEDRSVDVMIAIGTNFFYSLPIAVTLWFLDRGKRGTPREDTVLFLDARNVYRQVDRAHRDFLPEQIELLANTVRLYRGEEPESVAGSHELISERFPADAYVDVPGFCKVATITEIEAQNWSLSAGRYVGVAAGLEDDGDFRDRLGELHSDFAALSDEAAALRRKVDAVVQGLLEQ